MGRQQIYKGDPGLKQYYLVNDFTGGINNTSVDERTQDNEFRELLNVELDTKGMIQNRKGWGQLTLLNQLIEAKGLHLPYYNSLSNPPTFTNKYALIKVVRNEGNILRILKDYQAKDFLLTEFLALGLAYRLEILMIYETSSGIKIGLLTLSSDTNIDAFEEIATLNAGQLSQNKPLTNIETIEYTDFIYFSLSQLQSNLIGFGEYNIVEKKFRIIRDDETETAFIYKPSPYEVSKIGFNILSKNPLTDIRKQEGFVGIQGAFLTKYEVNANGQLIDTETPILNIPADGKFTLNVIFSGTGLGLENFVLEFFTRDANRDLPSTVTGDYVSETVFEVEGVAIIPSTDRFYIATNTGLTYTWNGSKFVVSRFREIPVTAENVVVAAKLDDTGITRFACNLPFKNLPEINIRVKLVSGIVLSQVVVSPANTFASTTAMVNNFNPAVNTKFAVANGSTLFDLYNKTNITYQYEKLLGYTYNNVTYTSIFNDLNLTTTPKWVESNVNEYNATLNRDTYLTYTLAEYDNMTVNNVPIAASSKVDNFVLRVNRSYWQSGGTTTTYSWVVGTQEDYNDAFYTSSVTLSTDNCILFDNITTSNASNSLGSPSNYLNGQVVRVTSSYFEDGVTYSCGTKYFIAVHTTTTTPGSYVTSSTYKYYKKVTELVGATGAILSYNPNDSKLYYRSGATKTEILSGIALIPGIATKIPNVTEILLAGTAGVEANYYRYNGGMTGTISDFSNVLFSDTTYEVEYIDIYPVGSNPNSKPIEQLQTKDFRILEIGSRLVMYRENVIWFSDLYQFDYIPNYNYIILPLTPDDNITNISYFKGSYIIFTKERIYKMSGTFGGQDFQIQIVSDAIGCISPFSVKPFNNTLVFMTRDGLYRIKQNYYLGGLENVEKIDKQIGDILPTNVSVYAVLHNEQYMLFYNYTGAQFTLAPFNVVKMYYNMEAPQGYPFVKDKHAIAPEIVAVIDDELMSLENGLFYMYDVGYTDFLPKNPTDEQKASSNYQTRVVTPNLFFYYPTHDKKFKSIIIKTNANEVVPLYFNIYVDNKLVYKHTDFKAVRQPDGTLLYEAFDVANLTIGNPGLIGDYDLGVDKLGDYSTQVHKIVIAGKGKTIKVDLAQRTDQYFGIQDIGYVYKMGKAREDR